MRSGSAAPSTRRGLTWKRRSTPPARVTIASAVWQTLLELGQLWSARDYAQARSYFQAALDQARDLADPLAIARSLNRLGNCRANQDEPLQAQADHQEALAIFEQLGAQAEVAQTLDLLAMAMHLAGDDASAAQRWRQAVDAFRELGDRTGLSSSLAALAVLASEYTAAQPLDVHPRDAVLHADEAFEIARSIGWQPGQAFASIVRFNALAALGEYRRLSSRFDDLGWPTSWSTASGARPRNTRSAACISICWT